MPCTTAENCNKRGGIDKSRLQGVVTIMLKNTHKNNNRERKKKPFIRDGFSKLYKTKNSYISSQRDKNQPL